VRLPCPLGLLSQWEEMAAVKLPCPLEATEVAVVEGIAVAELLSQYEMPAVKLPCPLEVTEVAVVELLVAEGIAVAELLS
jgi:hypothetical protein